MPALLQVEALEGGVELVVATPGRLLAHLEEGNIELEDVVRCAGPSMPDHAAIDKHDVGRGWQCSSLCSYCVELARKRANMTMS